MPFWFSTSPSDSATFAADRLDEARHEPIAGMSRRRTYRCMFCMKDYKLNHLLVAIYNGIIGGKQNALFTYLQDQLPVWRSESRQTRQRTLAQTRPFFPLAMPRQLQLDLPVEMHQPVDVALRLVVAVLQQ